MTKVQAFMLWQAKGCIGVYFDPRRPGVVVPPKFRRRPSLCLQYGRNLPTPITDLEVDAFGIRATLSFNREFSLTFVPWGALFAIRQERDGISDGETMVWEDDVPTEVAVQWSNTNGPAPQESN